MTAKGIFINNEDEINEAERLGYSIPNPEYIELPLAFDLNQVEVAFINPLNRIVVFMKTSGRFEFVNEAGVFETIKKHLNSQI